MNLVQPTVHVVDDDASCLRATTRLLRASGFAAEGYASASEFLAQCVDTHGGCVVIDLQMPGLSGLELQETLARSSNPMPVVFLTGHGDVASTVRAMRAGAEDFLEKCAPLNDLLDAVRRALARGERERAARERMLALAQRFRSLSAREREVLDEVLRGRLNKQMASDLGINERTVKLHRASIMKKLEVRSVAELAQLAQAAGERRLEEHRSARFGRRLDPALPDRANEGPVVTPRR